MSLVLGVVGAGVMGAGVAQAAAERGMRVVLLDLTSRALESARRSIIGGLRLGRLLDKSSRGQTTEEVLARIDFTTHDELLAQADFVVENVTERWDVKLPVWQRLDAICPRDTVMAANTSAIPITKIASATTRPDRVVGIHFMNPVPLKPMVELIRGHHSSEAALEAARAFLARMGKTAVLVEDAPGFVTNRVLMLMVNEAIFLVQEGVSNAADIDRIFKGCFGHKMGPLETADMIGLDTILHSIEVLHESLADSKYRPCPLLKRMVAAGLCGRKSGKGFFDYTVGGGDQSCIENIRGFLGRLMVIDGMTDDDDIFMRGFNSLHLVELFTFLEKEFGLNVDDADLEFDDFRSLHAIRRFVERKRG